MAKIRKDLVGVVYAVNESGNFISLKAKDDVPEGYFVGGHVLKDGDPRDQTPPWKKPPQQPVGAPAVAPEETPAPAPASPQEPAPAISAPAALEPPPKSGAGSGAPEWRDYALRAAAAAGLQIEIPAEAKRSDIIEALESAKIRTE